MLVLAEGLFDNVHIVMKRNIMMVCVFEASYIWLDERIFTWFCNSIFFIVV